MELGIKGKVALVTASSQGLGRAAASALAREGARVALCSRDTAAVRAAAEEIAGETGAETEAFTTDVSDPEGIRRLVAGVMERFGALHILVNNAGGPPAGPIDRLTDEEWEKGFRLTMMSMVRLTRAVLPGMKEQRWGRVISLVSLAAKQPIDDLLMSSTLRPGILGISKVLATQYGRHGVTVNTVCPGYVLTKRMEDLGRVRSKERNITMEQYLTESAAAIPAGRLGRPEEIGDVVAFLASERASFINGANLLVDGGQARGIH